MMRAAPRCGLSRRRTMEVSDFRHGGYRVEQCGRATNGGDGLVLFGFVQAARRRSAASLARKASAAVTWRCQACQRNGSRCNRGRGIGGAPVVTPGTNAHLVCRLML